MVLFGCCVVTSRLEPIFAKFPGGSATRSVVSRETGHYAGIAVFEVLQSQPCLKEVYKRNWRAAGEAHALVVPSFEAAPPHVTVGVMEWDKFGLVRA